MLVFPSKIGQNKKLVRDYCKNIRKSLFLTGELSLISKTIIENILKSQIFKKSKHIMLFYPIKDEINLLGLLGYENKNFYFPKCVGKNLLVCPNNGNFKNNKYLIPEPVSEPVLDLNILDIIFTPALCADKNKYRIGYGAGYYDRFFSNNVLKAKKIIPISYKLICNSLPHDEYDLPCDLLVCEKGFI